MAPRRIARTLAILTVAGCAPQLAPPPVVVAPAVPTGTSPQADLPEPLPGYKSGSRLVARRLVGDDGSEQFKGWHDSKLGTDCEPLRAADASTRCLPTTYWNVGYSDGACTEPVFFDFIPHLRSQKRPPTYLVERQSGPPFHHAARRVTGQIELSEVFRWDQSKCRGKPLPKLQTFHTTGPRLPPENFVRMQEVTGP
jgi:hypothetical protein